MLSKAVGNLHALMGERHGDDTTPSLDVEPATAPRSRVAPASRRPAVKSPALASSRASAPRTLGPGVNGKLSDRSANGASTDSFFR